MPARTRLAKGWVFQMEIRVFSRRCPFLLEETSRSYRSRASERVVLSYSFLETKTPRSISASICLAQASAEAFVSKVRVIRSNPFLLTIALQDPLLFWKDAIFDLPPGEIIGWKDPSIFCSGTIRAPN
ncbi:MAG: integrase [Leptospirillum sp. Group II 'C75']|uniref:Integrase n=1 Tax=Leptospirillum sp. Group II '5-way CG' TaxID=419541 RepID=B6AKZ4_9BACT|nr:MAG: integrase [Leptospirillum sp. Group II '5-way CG']EIJ77202.1 MAG: integrase [Leptospirillum sp. Group II 'C75']